jgi:hypothetical protein
MRKGMLVETKGLVVIEENAEMDNSIAERVSAVGGPVNGELERRLV